MQESLTILSPPREYPTPGTAMWMGYEPILPSKFSSPGGILQGTGGSEDGQKW